MDTSKILTENGRGIKLFDNVHRMTLNGTRDRGAACIFRRGAARVDRSIRPCEKSKYSPVCALVHAHAPGVCGHDSTPPTPNHEMKLPSVGWELHFMKTNADNPIITPKVDRPSKKWTEASKSGQEHEKWTAFSREGLRGRFRAKKKGIFEPDFVQKR